jgi:hypothetical protein
MFIYLLFQFSISLPWFFIYLEAKLNFSAHLRIRRNMDIVSGENVNQSRYRPGVAQSVPGN